MAVLTQVKTNETKKGCPLKNKLNSKTLQAWDVVRFICVCVCVCVCLFSSLLFASTYIFQHVHITLAYSLFLALIACLHITLLWKIPLPEDDKMTLTVIAEKGSTFTPAHSTPAVLRVYDYYDPGLFGYGAVWTMNMKCLLLPILDRSTLYIIIICIVTTCAQAYVHLSLQCHLH